MINSKEYEKISKAYALILRTMLDHSPKLFDADFLITKIEYGDFKYVDSKDRTPFIAYFDICDTGDGAYDIQFCAVDLELEYVPFEDAMKYFQDISFRN